MVQWFNWPLRNSYLGYTQIAIENQPGTYICAGYAHVPTFDWYETTYYSGAFCLGHRITWNALVAKPQIGEPQLVEREMTNSDWNQVQSHLPLLTMDETLGEKITWMRDSIDHPLRDEYWDVFDLVQNIDKIECPNLIISGWYDIFLDQALRYTGQIRQNSANEQARRQQHIIIGPWGHLINKTPEGREFGPTATKNVNELTVQWFAHWLNGEDNGIDKLPYLQLFVMGANHWREADDWPLPETQWTKYYLHSSGSANTATGNGSLNVNEPECEPPDKFIYDPENPVPTIGGEWRFYDKWGPQDQSAVEARDDVLVYTSAVLDDPLEVTGPIQVVLYAATDAPDTDWTAKLVDVYPDGKDVNLCDGITRARYRNPEKGAQSLEAGKVYRYEINLWATSNEFQPGHRIRLQISSSSFPRFDRNPNTGKPFGLSNDLAIARQQVLHEAEHASHILLPVIPTLR